MVAPELTEALGRMENSLLEAFIARRFPMNPPQVEPVTERSADRISKAGTTVGVVDAKVKPQGGVKSPPMVGVSQSSEQQPRTARDSRSEAVQEVTSGTKQPVNKGSRWPGLSLVRLILNRVFDIFRS